MTTKSFRSTTAAAASILLLGLTACASSPGTATTASTESTTDGATAANYPLTLDNCGFEVTFDAAPERVITIKSSTTELLLALGLEDSIVGASFLDGEVPEKWLPDASTLSIISDKVPGQEATLELEPDLIFGGWESNFSAEGVGERDELQSLLVNSYVAPSACKDPAYMPDPLTFDVLFDEIAEAGQIFDAEEAADALIAEQQATLDGVEPSTEGFTALWYSSGSDVPYVGAGKGSPQMIMDAAGLENIAGDVEDTWTSMSWEAIVDADPNVIVLIDAEWNSAEEKIERLESSPATATLDAVTNQRYVIVPFASGEAGVRNVEAVASIVDQLNQLG